MQLALFFGPMQLLAMELLQTTILFNPLLKIGLVLRRNILNLFVQPFDFDLAHHILLLELFETRFGYFIVALTWHLGLNCANLFLGVAKAFSSRPE